MPVVTVPRDKKHGTVINDKPEPRLNARALCALDEPPSAEATRVLHGIQLYAGGIGGDELPRLTGNYADG